ncbi:MAG: BrnT family toxin [Ahrensia sp.]|nr:BrnT family toxin [Ahrensia sp.]
MRYVWDEKKRQHNLKKHGVDFVDAVEVLEGNHLIAMDDGVGHDEERLIALGYGRNGRLVVVHVEYDEVCRIISARKAVRSDERRFAQLFS